MSELSMLHLIFLGLVGLNVVQFFFWAYQVQRLVDKLMSRTYYDYQTAKTLAEEKPRPVKLEEGIPEDLRILNEFQI